MTLASVPPNADTDMFELFGDRRLIELKHKQHMPPHSPLKSVRLKRLTLLYDE